MERLFVDLVGSTNDFLWSKLLIIMLVICGIYFTFKLNFVQFRMLKEMVRVLM
ncbi:sodium:alanine symporter, partial [Bacillus thuringiensis]|nr:sodium:alanine symporter [Bacillus thuringiensis]